MSGSSLEFMPLPPLTVMTRADVRRQLGRMQCFMLLFPLYATWLVGRPMITPGVVSVSKSCLFLMMVLSCWMLFVFIRKRNIQRAYLSKVGSWLPPVVVIPPKLHRLKGKNWMVTQLMIQQSQLEADKHTLLRDIPLPDTLEAANTYLIMRTAWSGQMEEYCLHVRDHAEMLRAYLARIR
jgi:hypothetical protein